MAERWLQREIARGLQGLVALRLPGGPADDSITLTLDVWLVALDTRARSWTEEADSKRIQHGFRLLYARCDRWPAPRTFLDVLPARPQAKALAAPAMSENQRQQNLARMRTLFKQLNPFTRTNPAGDTHEH